MTTPLQVITVRTRQWILSAGIIHGLVSIRTLKTIANLVPLVLDPKHLDTDHMVISDNFQFPKTLEFYLNGFH